MILGKCHAYRSENLELICRSQPLKCSLLESDHIITHKMETFRHGRDHPFCSQVAAFATWVFKKKGKKCVQMGHCWKVLDPIQQAITDIFSFTFPMGRCLYPGLDLTTGHGTSQNKTFTFLILVYEIGP